MRIVSTLFLMILAGLKAEAFPTAIPPGIVKPQETVQVLLTNGTSWTVPPGVNVLTSVEAWGGGGGAGGRTFGYSKGGAGGGAYSNITNYTVTPGASISYQVGTGGVSMADANGGAGSDSWFVNTGTLLAKGGGGSYRISNSGGTGGLASDGVGSVKYSGGIGGDAIVGFGGGGGAAAGSPTGNGADGVDTTVNNGAAGGTAPGGGNGGNGGTAAASPTAGFSGTAHANGGGGGGGGGANNSAGGGAGAAGGAGGFPGGGAGGPGANINGTINSAVSLNGANGALLITYTGKRAGDSPTARWKMNETSGTVAFDSVAHFHGALTGAAGVTSDPAAPLGTGLTFDGSNDIFTVHSTGNAFQKVPFTWTMWTKFTSLPSSTGQIMAFLRAQHNSSPWASYFFYLNHPTNIPSLSIYDSTGTGSWVEANSAVTTGTWYHFTLTVDSNYLVRLFVNGVQQTDTASIGSLFYASSNQVIIGGNNGSVNNLHGSMDDVRFYNRVLSNDEIMYLYREGTQ